MRRPAIKVCGMRDRRNIAAIAALEPDYMGFIFYEWSARYAGGLTGGDLDAVGPEIVRTGVFVNEGSETILRVRDRFGLGAVQLHGEETPEQCLALRGETAVIKAFPIGGSDDIENLSRYEGKCDYFLFDTPTITRGGSGRKFDHTLLNLYRGTTPWLLSGGIGPDDATAILSMSRRPEGVDINSRFETSPGVKDTDAVKKFIEHIRN